MTGWIIPITDRKRPQVQICASCERRDPFMARIENRDAGVLASHYNRWRQATIDACEHPDHAEAHHD